MAVNETRYRSHDGTATHETALRGDYDITWAEEASRKAALFLIADVPMVKDIGDGRSGIAYADAAQVLMQFVTLDPELDKRAVGSGYVEEQAWGRW